MDGKQFFGLVAILASQIAVAAVAHSAIVPVLWENGWAGVLFGGAFWMALDGGLVVLVAHGIELPESVAISLGWLCGCGIGAMVVLGSIWGGYHTVAHLAFVTVVGMRTIEAVES